jgi:hypothetical protein
MRGQQRQPLSLQPSASRHVNGSARRHHTRADPMTRGHARACLSGLGLVSPATLTQIALCLLMVDGVVCSARRTIHSRR